MNPTHPTNPANHTDPFETLRPPAACGSGWQLSRAALGELPPAAMDAVMAHMATCDACQTRFITERAAIEAAQDEPLPLVLREQRPAETPFEPANTDIEAVANAFDAGADPETTFEPANTNVHQPESIAQPTFSHLSKSVARPTFSRRRLAATLGVFAVAALAFFAIRPPDPTEVATPTERAKGTLDVRVAIQRNGVLVADDVPAATAGPLAINDQLRLRVGRQAGAHIVVAGFESGAWTELFRGLAPSDGWLPVGLVVTAGDPPRLRVLACPNAPAPDAAAAPTAPPDCTRLEYGFAIR